jgi:hypothetical protein
MIQMMAGATITVMDSDWVTVAVSTRYVSAKCILNEGQHTCQSVIVQ